MMLPFYLTNIYFVFKNGHNLTWNGLSLNQTNSHFRIFKTYISSVSSPDQMSGCKR